MSTFGSRLKEARVNAMLSQSKLSKLTGYSQPQIVQYERDTVKPPLKKIIELSKVLNVSTDWLNYGDGSESQEEMKGDDGSFTIGQRISEQMDKVGINSEKLAILSGLPEELINDYLSDSKPIILSHVQLIAMILKVNRSWLAFGSK